MKLSTRIVIGLVLTVGLFLPGLGNFLVVDALQVTSVTALNSTPLPVTLQPSPGPTATIDPASIGDTSGVIVIVIVVVIVIIVGVLWGSREFRMEAQKTRAPKE
jgi:hypothetical protein